MARIGIITCSNCTQDVNCAAVVCLADMRKRRGFFERYPRDEPLDLVGLISCAGCPTVAAPDKILKRVRSVAEFKLNALHFSFCMTAVCPFLKKYAAIIQEAYPDLELVMGTHQPVDKRQFMAGLHELLCPTAAPPQTIVDMVRGTLKLPNKGNI